MKWISVKDKMPEDEECSHEWGETIYHDDAPREYFACTKCGYLSPICKEKDHFNFSDSADHCIYKEEKLIPKD